MDITICDEHEDNNECKITKDPFEIYALFKLKYLFLFFLKSVNSSHNIL
jgi:hypothetical protein